MHPHSLFNDPRRLIRIFASLFVVSVSATVLFGWTISSSLLTRLHPDLPVMVPNTAACLLMMAGVLVLCGLERPTMRCRVAAAIAGGVSFLVGSLTFAEYLFDAGLGIDGILLHFAQSVDYEINPGRMAPHTALGLMAAGPAIAFLCRKKVLGQLSEIFSVLTLAIAFSALLGHLFGAQALQGLSKTNGMALHSAISLMVLSAGMLVANPRSLIIGLFFSNPRRSSRKKASAGCSSCADGHRVRGSSGNGLGLVQRRLRNGRRHARLYDPARLIHHLLRTNGPPCG